jgi:hypothetical protein
MNKIVLTKDAWDAYYRGEDAVLDKNTNEYVSYKTFYERERDRYWGIREAAWKFLKEHEQNKGTEAYNLIWQTFVLATHELNRVMFELNDLKEKEKKNK